MQVNLIFIPLSLALSLLVVVIDVYPLLLVFRDLGFPGLTRHILAYAGDGSVTTLLPNVQVPNAMAWLASLLCVASILEGVYWRVHAPWAGFQRGFWQSARWLVLAFGALGLSAVITPRVAITILALSTLVLCAFCGAVGWRTGR